MANILIAAIFLLPLIIASNASIGEAASPTTSDLDASWRYAKPFGLPNSVPVHRDNPFDGGRSISDSPSSELPHLVDQPLSVVGIEVTQAVQNLTNDAPLYAGRATFVRVHFQNDGEAPFSGVTGLLTPIRNGAVIGKPLMPSNKAWVDRGPAQRSYTNAGLLFEMPTAALSGTVTLEYGSTADAAGPISAYCGASPVLEDGCRVTVTFVTPPKLSAKLLAITSIDAGGTPQFPQFSDLERAARELRATMPVGTLDWTSGAYNPPGDSQLRASESTFWANALVLLNKYKVLDGCFSPLSPGCNRSYVGIVTGRPPNQTGTAFEHTEAALGYLTDNLTLSHEIGHLAGRSHVSCIFDPSLIGNSKDFPNSDGVIGNTQARDLVYYGFNPLLRRPIEPNTCDLMSEATSRWPSRFTYANIADRLALNASGPVGPVAQSDGIVVSGIITRSTGVASFAPFYTTKLPMPTLPASGTYQLRLEDAGGTVLSTVSISNTAMADDGLEGIQPFVAVVPMNPAISRITLLRNGAPLVSRAAAETPPTIAGLTPNGGETWTGATAEIKWANTGSGLSSTVQLSRDNGTTWQTLIVDLSGTSYTVDLATIGGSSQALVRVLTSDGFTTAIAQSAAPFTITNHSPIAAIESPSAGRAFWGDQPINFFGGALDPQAAQLDGAALTWQSSIDGELGSGTMLSRYASDLSVGPHTITLTAQSAISLTTAVTTTISVSRAAPVLPAAPQVGPSSINLVVTAGRIANTSVAFVNAGDGTLSASLSTTKPWMKLAQTTVQANVSVPITIEATTLAPGLYNGDVIIQPTGFASMSIPVTVVVQEPRPTFVPSAFFAVRSDQPTPTPTPPPGISGIAGRLVRGGSAAANIPLSLIHTVDLVEETIATTTTDSGGAYAFLNVPSLGQGQDYFVAFRNTSTAPNGLLDRWYGNRITSYAAGTYTAGGDFDLADFPLATPADQASETLPAQFCWTPRGIPLDNYSLVIYDPLADRRVASRYVGTANCFTVTALPAGWPSVGDYLWWVEVHQGTGTRPFNYGVSYTARKITLSATGTAAYGVTNPSDRPAQPGPGRNLRP